MNWAERQEVVGKLEQLGCLQESTSYDRVTGMAARTFKVPVCAAVIAHNDKLHWLSWAGKFFDRNLPKQTLGDSPLVSHVMAQPPGQVTVIQDCKRHSLTRSMTDLPVPGVPYARFICSVPLYLFGVSVGVLMIADVQPWPDGLSIRQKCFMVDFAKLIMSELRLQYETGVKKASYVTATAHNMKIPLACLSFCLDTLAEAASQAKIEEARATAAAAAAGEEGGSSSMVVEGEEEEEGGAAPAGVAHEEVKVSSSSLAATAASVQEAVSTARMNVEIMYSIVSSALGDDIRPKMIAAANGDGGGGGGGGGYGGSYLALPASENGDAAMHEEEESSSSGGGGGGGGVASPQVARALVVRKLQGREGSNGGAGGGPSSSVLVEDDFRPREHSTRMNRIAYRGLRRVISGFDPVDLVQRCVHLLRGLPAALVPINVHVRRPKKRGGAGAGGGGGGDGMSDDEEEEEAGLLDMPKVVYSDYQILWHCLVDMVGNACKYTREGCIDVIVSAFDVDNAMFTKVLVQDTGPGFPKGMEEVVFVKPFCTARRKEDGAGLGLFSVGRNIKVVGGSSGVCPGEGGKGLKVWVQFPNYGYEVTREDIGVDPRSALAQLRAEEEVQKQEEELEHEEMSMVIDDVKKQSGDVVTAAAEDLSSVSTVGRDRRSAALTPPPPAAAAAALQQAATRTFITSTQPSLQAQPGPEEGASLSSSPQQRQRHRRAIIIDDCRVFCKLLSAMLSKRGWEVEVARDGKEGLDMLKSAPYVMVFMDFLMPVMSGIECTLAFRAWERAQIAAAIDEDEEMSYGTDEEGQPAGGGGGGGETSKRRRAYIIGVSAVSSGEELVHGAQAGMDRTLEKPITPSKLDDVLGGLEEYLRLLAPAL